LHLDKANRESRWKVRIYAVENATFWKWAYYLKSKYAEYFYIYFLAYDDGSDFDASELVDDTDDTDTEDTSNLSGKYVKHPLMCGFSFIEWS